MARRTESRFATAALALLLALVVLYGCRAFDPEPVVVNKPPDTFITGAPAETTGTVFRRHVYWYGNDADGQVVRYIYAITDSTVLDRTDPSQDEEDARFDPADDVTTLEIIDGRFVGYTTRTDSIFEFTIDRGALTSKDITFHIVAVDDLGEIDPEPARLQFFNNSLGNPVIRFTVSTFDTTGANEQLRWIGTVANGPILPGDEIWRWEGPYTGPYSPEDTERPFIGFRNPFKICWEASSPNGAIEGYQFRASELDRSPFHPQELNEETGEVEAYFDPDATCFDFGNLVAPEDIPPPGTPPNYNPDFVDECPSLWEDCPDSRRWSSGPHRIQVLTIDVAQVESEATLGELQYVVNYPPVTSLIEDAEWPKYFDNGVEFNFSENDTIPDGAYVIFQKQGYDRLEQNRSELGGLPCCDVRFDPTVPEVRYQTRIEDARARNDSGGNSFWSTLFSPAEEADTLGFRTGPFDYTVTFRSQDEHDTVDPNQVRFQFFAGFPPSLTSLFPTDGDTLMLRNNQGVPPPWPENQVPYQVQETVMLYWDGTTYRTEDCDDPATPVQECVSVTGTYYRYRVEFVGTGDAREATTSIRAWSYALFSPGDPSNFVRDGAGTDNLSFFDPSPEPNRWLMAQGDDGPRLFVPDLIWTASALFDPENEASPFSGPGTLLAGQLGELTLQVIGKTVRAGDKHTYYPFTVRPCETLPECTKQDYDLTKLGRRTGMGEVKYFAYLGLDPLLSGSITELFPDPDYVP